MEDKENTNAETLGIAMEVDLELEDEDNPDLAKPSCFVILNMHSYWYTGTYSTLPIVYWSGYGLNVGLGPHG